MTRESSDDRSEDRRQEPGDGRPFRFDDLPPRIRDNVERQGWSAPLPVQEQVIPLLLARRDVIVQSRTGSGKTGAFALPICEMVDPERKDVQALILVPTRELAEQVNGVLTELFRDTGVRSVAVYGGAAYGPQIQAFERHVHVIVATPGRMIDHLSAGRVSLKKLDFLVFDEADEMLSMGFYKSMTRILSYVPEDRQTALFSATIPPGVAALARSFTRDAEHVMLSSDALHVEEVDHIYYVVNSMYKDRALLKLIEMDNLEAALIFCNTKREVEYLGVFLQNFGYDGDFISGDLTQAARDQAMERIRTGRLRFLVATDIAARGIDISHLGYVILYNLPQAHEHYIHRAGRTGRAGAGGIAISLVSIIEEMELKKRAREFGIKLIKKELPTDEELEKRVAERLRVMLEEKYRGLSNLEKERLHRFIPLAREFGSASAGSPANERAGSPAAGAGGSPADAEAEELTEERIIAMLFDQFYQEMLHKPLVPRDEPPPERAAPRRPRRGEERGSGAPRKGSSRRGSRRRRP